MKILSFCLISVFKLSDGISGIDEVNAYDYISWKECYLSGERGGGSDP